MRRLLLIISFLSLGSCTQFFMGSDPPNTAVSVFDEFWKGVDQNWAEFETKHVNWDSLYNVYRPKVTSASSEADLFNVLQGLVNNLKDAHTDIHSASSTNYYAGYLPVFPNNFYGIRWIQTNYATATKGNAAIGYGLIKPDVGYIYIGTFFNSEDQYAIIDDILKSFGSVKGIIIDVRSNGGGNGPNAETIASRFADQKRIYDFVRYRSGKLRNQMGDFIAEEISPAGSRFFGKVAVLTNRHSFSATENFILMMKTFPQVIQIGDNSFGGSGSSPILKELPMGLYYRVSTTLLCGLDKLPISKGIPPDINVQTTKADSLMGKDTIIERAIVEVRK